MFHPNLAPGTLLSPLSLTQEKKYIHIHPDSEGQTAQVTNLNAPGCPAILVPAPNLNA